MNRFLSLPSTYKAQNSDPEGLLPAFFKNVPDPKDFTVLKKKRPIRKKNEITVSSYLPQCIKTVRSKIKWNTFPYSLLVFSQGHYLPQSI